MSTKLDLEQHILSCWNITKDIDLLMKGVLEKDMTPDEISNFLLGLKTIYDMRFEETFDCFEQLLREKGI